MNEHIERLRRDHPNLHAECFDFLRRNGGREAALSIPPGWVQIWTLEFAITGSAEYAVTELLPGYFAFGSNGGGELFVIPESGETWPVLMVPAGDLAPESLVVVAKDLSTFESCFANSA